MINVEVKNKRNESNANLLRRFSRKVNYSGILGRARQLRSHTRKVSPSVEKKEAIRKMKRRKEVDRLIKLGKLPDRRRRERVVKPDEKDE